MRQAEAGNELGLLDLLCYTVILWYLWGICSRTPSRPKSVDAQVYKMVQSSQPSICVDAEPSDMEGQLYSLSSHGPHASILGMRWETVGGIRTSGEVGTLRICFVFQLMKRCSLVLAVHIILESNLS